MDEYADSEHDISEQALISKLEEIKDSVDSDLFEE
jgi:hypothetical protein